MKTLYSFLLLTIPFFSFSQTLHVDSTRFITGNRRWTQIANSISTTHSGIFFVGNVIGNPGGIIPNFSIDTVGYSVLLGKIDSSQRISWLKVYGGSKDDVAVSSCQTNDGGFAVLAQTQSNDGNVTGYRDGGDLWLIKIDSTGNLQWERTYGGMNSDLAISIANTPDHGLIILGATNSNDGDVPFHYGDFFTFDWLVIKTDSVGNVQWSKDLGGTDDEYQHGSILSVDTVYYLVGTSASKDMDCIDTIWHLGVDTKYDCHILELNSNGGILWDSSYGGSGNDITNCAVYDFSDSTIVIAGNTYSNDYFVTGFHGGVSDMWTVKIKKNGQMVWQKPLGGSEQEGATSICAAHGGGYIVYGGISPGLIGNQNLSLFYIDNAGNEIASKIFGGTEYDYPSSVLPYLKGYVVTGFSNSVLFTEGSNYGNFSSGGAFVTYIDTALLPINNLVRGVKNSAGFTIYPNPAYHDLMINVPNDQIGNLAIVNLIGQTMFEQTIERKKNISVDVSGWANGIYLVKWQGEDGTVQMIKLLKE